MTARAIRQMYAPKPRLERPIQREAIRLIRMAGFEPFHVPNGAHLAGGKLSRAKQMAALKADGLRTGFPDLGILGLFPRFGLIECKREGATDSALTEDQVFWRDRLTELGWPWFFLNKPEDVFAAFKAWGWR